MSRVEVVWVYGASGAGKATFIRSVLAGNPVVASEFAWEGKRLGVCQESLDWVARYPDDRIAEKKRYNLESIISVLAKEYDVLLIKGQDIDLSLGIPQAMKAVLPEAIHRIIFIDVGLEELFQRVVHKPWWDNTIKRAEEEGWLEEQIDRLMELRSSFEFTIVDGRAIGHYEEEDLVQNIA
jgi:hypothetical protein